MMNLSIHEILEATQGRLLFSNPTETFQSFSTDSRTMQAKDFFVCLKGERFDAHDLLEEILQKKPHGILIQKNRWNESLAQKYSAVWIGVEDTLQALGDIARAWRRKFAIPVVAITGTNGKTTTKDMIAAILSQKYKTLATEGNLNNLIGVPLTLLRLRSEHEAAVIEMGMNDFGEISRLAEITEPTVGLITNVGYGHLEKLKNLEGVARAKGELFERLPRGALALVNQDDPLIARMKVDAYPLSFATEHNAQICCTHAELGEKGVDLEIRYLGKPYRFHSPVPGRSGLKNATAAIAAGFALGVEPEAIRKALKAFKVRAMRMEILPIKNGLLLLNDCYNANPSSMAVALETLSALKKQTPGLAILGEMLELGDFAKEGHRQVGKAVAQNQIGSLIAVGPYANDLVAAACAAGMENDRCFATQTQAEIEPILKDWALRAKTILVKGSRGAGMEKVSEKLKNL